LLRTKPVPHSLAGSRSRRLAPVLIFVVAAAGAGLNSAVTSAATLNLSWTDNSGGVAQFSIERRTGTTGIYGEIGQQAAGIASYSDNTVTDATTYCYRVRAFDSAGVSGYSNEACRSVSAAMALTVSKGGSGTGTVASTPTGIDCGSSCSATYPGGTPVTLSAAPAAGAVFSGWSGSGCSGTDPCTLAGTGSMVVNATFDVASISTTFVLSVNKKGPGTISSSLGDISCGNSCSASYASGTAVTLTAVPANGARFLGWSGGGCRGTGTCVVMVNTNTTVTASFTRSGKK
jgi:Divergent InlB B-repeat domain